MVLLDSYPTSMVGRVKIVSDYYYTLMILVIGDSSTGKDEFCRDFSSNCFKEDFIPTIGVEFYSKILNYKDKIVNIQLWNFGWNEKFKFLLSQYCKGQHGVIIMFDVTNSKTLEKLPNWLQVIRKNAGNIPIFLVGNKFNSEIPRMISSQEGVRIMESYKLSAYVEISTKTGDNVENLFQNLTENILRNYNNAS